MSGGDLVYIEEGSCSGNHEYEFKGSSSLSYYRSIVVHTHCAPLPGNQKSLSRLAEFARNCSTHDVQIFPSGMRERMTRCIVFPHALDFVQEVEFSGRGGELVDPDGVGTTA